MERILIKISEQAKALKIRNFKKLFAEYVKAQQKAAGIVIADSVTQFEGQELELNCGQWQDHWHRLLRRGGRSLQPPFIAGSPSRQYRHRC